jgi:molybdenum cofactor cytidylyltransferase
VKLKQALRATHNTRLAIVGAGGKTTALFTLAREYSTGVLVATSTHLGEHQAAQADRHIIIRPGNAIKRGDVEGITLVTGPNNGEKRLTGLSRNHLLDLVSLADDLQIPLLLEADGARNLSLKAPGKNEPVIPEWANTVLVCAGVTAIGRRLDMDTVHRPEIYSRLTGLNLGDIITKGSVQRLFLHKNGGLKGIPQGARKFALLNKADTPEQQVLGSSIGFHLLSEYEASLVASIENPDDTNSLIVHNICERVAGVILAAGGAARFGSPKIMADYQGKPLITHVVQKAVDSGLSPIIVVLGSIVEPVICALDQFNIQIVINEDWVSGQASSVRKGINSLPGGIGAALFLLADQPQIPVRLIKGLIEHHNFTQAPLIIPSVNGVRANPVLFDMDVLQHLTQIEGDQGGRQIFNQYPATLYPWPDENILLDVDTPEDLQKLMGIG